MSTKLAILVSEERRPSRNSLPPRIEVERRSVAVSNRREEIVRQLAREVGEASVRETRTGSIEIVALRPLRRVGPHTYFRTVEIWVEEGPAAELRILKDVFDRTYLAETEASRLDRREAAIRREIGEKTRG